MEFIFWGNEGVCHRKRGYLTPLSIQRALFTCVENVLSASIFNLPIISPYFQTKSQVNLYKKSFQFATQEKSI